MKNIKSIILLFLGIGLMISLSSFRGCFPDKQPDNPKVPTDTLKLKTGQVQPKRAEGGKYPSVKQDLNKPINEVDDTPRIIPDGPKRGEMKPLNKAYKIKQLKQGDSNGGAEAPLYFNKYSEITDASAHTLTPEPSVAETGETIITTGNFWMSLSKNSGSSFTSVNPTSIFPEDYGGFCCDQLILYIPEYDLFAWLLQYKAKNGVNAIRIAVQKTQVVRSSNGKSWVYWDFLNTDFASSGNLDRNEMSYGKDYLYWTSSVGGSTNRYVIRIPLKELQAMGTVNYQFTGSTDAEWSSITLNGSNGVYWAGHKNNSTMKVYSMMDADNSYSWRDVPAQRRYVLYGCKWHGLVIRR